LNYADNIIDSEDVNLHTVFKDCVKSKNSLGIYQFLIKLLDVVSHTEKNFVVVEVSYYKFKLF